MALWGDYVARAGRGWGLTFPSSLSPALVRFSGASPRTKRPGVRLTDSATRPHHRLKSDHRPTGAVMSTLAAPFRPLFRSDTYRALLFLAASLPIGAAALALLIAGWVGTGVLLITPLVVAVLIGFRGATGLLAAADAGLARALLGASARPRIGSGGTGYWRRGWAVATDASFWKQQGYLALRLTVSFACAVGELSLIAGALARSRTRSPTAGATCTSGPGRSTPSPARSCSSRPGSSASSSPAGWPLRSAAAARASSTRCSRTTPAPRRSRSSAVRPAGVRS